MYEDFDSVDLRDGWTVSTKSSVELATKIKEKKKGKGQKMAVRKQA